MTCDIGGGDPSRRIPHARVPRRRVGDSNEPDGAELIRRERATYDPRGLTNEHLDLNRNSELIASAMCYLTTVDAASFDPCGDFVLHMWPYTPDLFRPESDPVRNLVIAGAMIASEIDRQLRERANAHPAD